MDKNEQNIYDDITKEVTSKMDFNQIVNKVDYSQYKKEKKSFRFSKRLTIVLTSFILVFSLILVIIFIPKDNEKEKTIPSNLVNLLYNGFIKDTFESNIGNGPTIEMSGPRPAPPIIDGYFNYSTDLSDPSDGDANSDKIYLEMRSFKYMYEVEYKYVGVGLDYVTVYIAKELAQKIYEENKEIMDAPSAKPLDIVNGSIVDWFYSKKYYEENKVFWCQYAESNQIFSEIEDFVCVGVYQPQKRVIVREIFSNTKVNIVDNIYTKLYFKNEGNETLTPVKDKVDDTVSWYASDNLIDETNKDFLFNECYSSKINCVIDREANTIKIETYAVQSEDELAKNSSESLKNYYTCTNSVMLENTNPNNKLGIITYITYNYREFVQILQDLAKHK